MIDAVAATAPTLTDEQRAAADAVRAWLDDPERKQTFSLGGLAGSGKSFLLSHIVRELREDGARVQVVAPTGKAAHVLRRKGVTDAATIHQWRYDFVAEIRDKEKKKSTLVFDPKAVVATSDVVVCDEASMCSTTILRDMLDPGFPILFVGDHGQLPPVGPDPRIMSDLDARLETIMRQALDSPITRVAHAIRGGARPGQFDEAIAGDDRVQVVKMPTTEKVASYCLERSIDRVICGYNRTRHALNDDFRRRLGHAGPVCVGDELICLLNDYRTAIWNGSTMTVVHVEDEQPRDDVVVCDVQTDDDRVRRVFVDVETLREKMVPEEASKIARDDHRLFCDYGWAITAHKSQGSEMGSVFLVWEPFGSVDARVRWGYTAATRAKERLVVAA